MRTLLVLAVLLVPPAASASDADLVAEVAAAERAFAKSMADRDFDAFARFVAPDAIFLNGGQPLHGRDAILADWQRYFEGADAPFAWDPEWVIVLDDGSLAQTNGPVTAPDGTVFARFQSVWRRNEDGSWQVVFDNGHPVCKPSA